jgi:aspyridone synthetase trans-acting enoyl reductase
MESKPQSDGEIPTFQNALVAISPGVIALAKHIPVPEIKADQVLVKVKAVALNPSDWKLLDIAYTPGAIAGADFAGTVVKRGREVQKQVEIGDRVCGCVFGSNPACPTNGGFSEYVAVPSDLCLRIPNWMSFQDAASLGMGIITVGLAFRSLGIPQAPKESFSPVLSNNMPYALVYGGSTATGTLAIQFLRHHSYLPIAICSPSNFPLVKSRGAVAAFDYRSPRCREDVREWTEDRLDIVLDCITNPKSMTISYGAIGTAGGRYTGLESFPPRWKQRRKKVKADWILGWTAFGDAVELGGEYYREPSPQDRVFARDWAQSSERLLNDGYLKVHPIQAHESGLMGVIEGLQSLREGKVSGTKQVYVLE